MQDRHTIRANITGVKPSFVYFLHEEARFEEQSFWRLYNALVSLGRLEPCLKGQPKIAQELVQIYGYILGSFVYHLSETDNFRCRGLEDEERLAAVVERMKEAFYCAFTGAVSLEEAHDDGLINPKPQMDSPEIREGPSRAPVATPADRILRAKLEFEKWLDKTDDLICVALGIEGEWPFEDIRYDWHDSSVELHGCDDDFDLTCAQRKACLKLGFERCHLLFKDERRRHY